MKILAINCKPDLTYFTSRGLTFDIDYKTTTQVFPYFLARAGTPPIYTPDVRQYLTQFTGYQIIIVGWNPKDYPTSFANTGGYTHDVPINGAIWCTVRLDQNTNGYIVHEMMHSLVYYLNVIKGLNKSNATQVMDYMDSDKLKRPYFLNNDPENPFSNHAQTWEQIKPHLQELNNINTMQTYKYFNPKSDPKMIGVSDILMKKIDTIRGEVGFPISINSGKRTVAENTALKGSVEDSAHLDGLAVDISCKTSAQRYALIQSAIKNGITRIGISFTGYFLHLDIDKTKPQNVIWGY